MRNAPAARPSLDRIIGGCLAPERATKVVEGLGPLGRSLYSAANIQKGELILRFSGPVLDFEQAVAKGERECFPLQISDFTYVDLEEPGCFANHSCDPNAGIQHDLELIALVDIPAGAEVRYDYSTTMDEDYWTMPCKCQSSICRELVTDFKYLPAERRRRYIELGIVQSFILKSSQT
jgi:SET domain-containing protein